MSWRCFIHLHSHNANIMNMYIMNEYVYRHGNVMPFSAITVASAAASTTTSSATENSGRPYVKHISKILSLTCSCSVDDIG